MFMKIKHTCSIPYTHADCAVPPSPINGNVNVTSYGLLATYTCDLGHTLQGPVTRNCLTNNATWDGNKPTCGK